MTTYGELDSEKVASENAVCREIVREIVRFGVSQRQIYMIINLLGQELENIEHMQTLMTLVKEMQTDVHLLPPGQGVEQNGGV